MFKSISAQEMKIMSFNMQQPYNTNWNGRVAGVIQIIKSQQPDILGSQELHAYMKKQILDSLPVYSAYGVGRECDGSGEGSFIFFKTDKFEVDSAYSGSFWFKDNYQNCGRGYDPKYNRICTYVRFKAKLTGQYFYVFNSHFPTPDLLNARIASAKLLCNNVINRTMPDPVIITGDFNSTETERDPISYIKTGSSLKMRDTYRDVHPTDRVTTGFGTRYDFIFVEDLPVFQTLNAFVVEKPVASDHLPIVAIVKLGNGN
jgi:endonuclease/exonuclease/phosphatase family metal-dependent hydrolase